MIQRAVFSRKFSTIPDLIILLLVATVIYGLVKIGHQWRAEYMPTTRIDLSARALPEYTLYSGMRGIIAYFFSLVFTLVVGYAAAKSPKAERIIIPSLDILQSIPVLGFLPGLVLGLVALFPRTNTGLELACLFSIFTGQVWNMTFSFYSSLKSIPHDFNEAATVMSLNWWQRLRTLELPYSAVNLVWNSLLSMAGGWFFLSICEAFTLGDRSYRLPGLGAYMAVALEQGDTRAMILAVLAMVFLIVALDFFIWRPLLSWVQRFRLEEIPGSTPEEPLMQVVIRESRLLRWVKLQYRRWKFERQEHLGGGAPNGAGQAQAVAVAPAADPAAPATRMTSAWQKTRVRRRLSPKIARFLERAAGFGVIALLSWGAWELLKTLSQLNLQGWITLVRDALWTFLRVMIALVLSTIWTVPFGIWVGTSQRRIRFMQPIIQVMASFPAPMLYPLALILLFKFRIGFDFASMFLLMLGAQWYVLFNVLAGALRIPQQLSDALDLMGTARWDRWRTLYLPCVFPALVTGWVTAAGGAWNASIAAEVIQFHGSRLITGGLGATITLAAEQQDFPRFAASLTLMVVIVITLNRSLWSKLYDLTQTRYRMDL